MNAGIAPNDVLSGSTLVGATVTGTGFPDGAAIAFSGGSGPAPLAQNVVVDNSGAVHTVTFDVATTVGAIEDPSGQVMVGDPAGGSATAPVPLVVIVAPH